MKAHRLGLGLLICLLVGFGLENCSEKKEAGNEQLVRGLRAYRVAARAESRIRRFPSVLQPADVSVLSFEISGQLKAVNLQVGQKVQLGDLLAEIDPRSLQSHRPGKRRRPASRSTGRERRRRLPTQARASEKGCYHASRVRSVESQSYHRSNAT